MAYSKYTRVTMKTRRPAVQTDACEGFEVGDRVQIGQFTGTVTAMSYRDLIVQRDDSGHEYAYVPRYVRKIEA